VPGNVSCRIRCEKHDGLGNFQIRSRPSQRNLLDHFGTQFLVEHRRHRRLDVPGRNRIHGDAPRSHLACQRPRKPDQPRLRSRVIYLAFLSRPAHHTRNVHDPTPPIFHHLPQERLRNKRALDNAARRSAEAAGTGIKPLVAQPLEKPKAKKSDRSAATGMQLKAPKSKANSVERPDFGGMGESDQAGSAILDLAEQHLAELLGSQGGLGLARMVVKQLG